MSLIKLSMPRRRTVGRTALLVIGFAQVFVACGQKQQSNVNVPAATPTSKSTETASAASPQALLDPSILERIRTERWTGDFDEMIKRRYIRALVVANKTEYFYDGPQARGIIYEALREFEKGINDKLKTNKSPLVVVFIPIRRDELLKGLIEGRGDIAASNLAITAEREKTVSFSDPLRADAKQLVVTSAAAPAISSLDDLAGKQVYIRKSSRYWESLTRLNVQLKQQGKPGVILKAADENLEDEDILNLVNAGVVDITVTTDLLGNFWSQVFDSIKVRSDLEVATGDRIAWAVNPKSQKLLAEINEFVRDHKAGTSFGNTVLQRYLKNTKWARNNTAPDELEKFRSTIQFFKKYADQYKFAWLLIAAQAYQESQIDQSRRSPVGAVGVMQIKPSTASGHPINIVGVEDSVEKNIQAGVKYLRFIMDQYFKDQPKDPLNRGLFAMASYNAGPARVAKLRKQAKEEGLDPNKWFNNVEIIAAKEIGAETVTYVGNIYKYYVSYKLISERALVKREAVRTARAK